MRRVVVTGLGMVTPLGCGVEATWKRLIAGESGASRIEKFEVADLPAQIACQVPRGDGSTVVRLARGSSLTDFAEKIDANPAYVSVPSTIYRSPGSDR